MPELDPAAPRVALYARVSTIDKHQDPEVQLRELREYAARRGWVPTEFSDFASGAKESRPGLDEMMAAVEGGEFQAVLVWRFDRFGRSVQHLVRTLNRFKEIGVSFVSHQESIDTSTPHGEFMFTILAAFAQMERRVTQERVRAGMAKARQDGKQIGRPKRAIDLRPALAMLREGEAITEVAKAVGVPRRTLARHLEDAGHVLERGFLVAA